MLCFWQVDSFYSHSFSACQRAAFSCFCFFTSCNSSLSQVSEHQPTQQSTGLHQTVSVNIWWCFCIYLFIFSPRPESLPDPDGGSEYCRVFNPLYLWGLCSIWYQICISQMGFDCFSCRSHAYEYTRVQIRACTHIYIHMYWLKLGFAVLMFIAVKR